MERDSDNQNDQGKNHEDKHPSEDRRAGSVPRLSFTSSSGTTREPDQPESPESSASSLSPSSSRTQHHLKYNEPDFRHPHDTEDQRKQSTAETLVDAALHCPEAKDRHVRFSEHINQSIGMIHNFLNRQRGSLAEFDRVRDHDCRRISDTSEDTLGRKWERPTGGSVLSNLLKLEAQSHTSSRRRSSIRRPSRDQPEEKKRPSSVFSEPNLRPRPTRKKKISKKVARRSPNWLRTVASRKHVVPSLQRHKREYASPSSRRLSQDSLHATASQFEGVTFEDRVRIAFEIANILQKHEFIRKLAKVLMLYGCPAHRLEYTMKHVSATLNVDAEFFYVPDVMIMTFFDASTHTTETHVLRQTFSFDLHKLAEIYRLERLVAHGEVTVDEALDFIDRVESEPKTYPTWLKPFIYAVISLCGCVMFFGGRWKEAAIAAALAMLFAVYELLSVRFWGFRPIWEITVCIFIGFVARGITKYQFCFIPIAFASFINLLPGYVIAIAIIELVSRQVVSGVVRMVYAIIYSFLLGYGIEMGSELYITFDNDPSVTNPAPICQVAANANTCVSSESRWFYFLTVPLFALSYCQLLRMRLPRWPVAIVVSGTGFVINWLLSCKAAAPSQVVQVVPAFAVGLFGNILTKVTSRMSFDIVLIAIFYLVPGSLGLKAAIGFFGRNNEGQYQSQAAGFALSMIEISIGITIGLFIANMIIYPKGAQHTPLMNF